jgi:hypothetical protein
MQRNREEALAYFLDNKQALLNIVNGLDDNDHIRAITITLANAEAEFRRIAHTMNRRNFDRITSQHFDNLQAVIEREIQDESASKKQ